MSLYNVAHLLPVILWHKELIYRYRRIWHYSVISREVRNYTVHLDNTDRTQFGVSLDIVFRQLIDRYSEGATFLFRLESNNSQLCLMAVK